MSLNLKDFLEWISQNLNGAWSVFLSNACEESQTVHHHKLRYINTRLVTELLLSFFDLLNGLISPYTVKCVLKVRFVCNTREVNVLQ